MATDGTELDVYALQTSKAAKSFRKQKTIVFSPKQINQFIAENQDAWLTKITPQLRSEVESSDKLVPLRSITHKSILNALLEGTQLDKIRLAFPYRTETRFTWGEAPTYQLIQSIDEKGYYSHYSAVQFHQLTEQIPKVIYFNVEQPASGGGGVLSQEGINRAFQNKCRVSSNTIRFRDISIHKLNGQNTNQLGVTTTKIDKYTIRLTDISRTLIDITVRPVYAGGVSQVARAFKAAANRVSISTVVKYLKLLNYTYPYHQAIGYYLEKSKAYTKRDIDLLRGFPIEFDFYLNYQLKNPTYNKYWRLFIPQGF